MNEKTDQKVRAVALRRQGLTYSEILREIPVAKSTLSLWFRSVGLASQQKQHITAKRIEGQKKGAAARKNQRIRLQESIWSKAVLEVGDLSRRELWLIGIALYWAEGSKEKEWRPGEGITFSNSDPRMIRVFLAWVKEFAVIKKEDIKFSIYIHESKSGEVSAVREFWAKEIGIMSASFSKVYFKKNKFNSKRKNIGLLYNGLLRVRIPRSSILVRKIEGWVRGIDAYCRIV